MHACWRKRSTVLSMAALLLAMAARVSAQSLVSPPLQAERPSADHRLDQLYYLQPHNTYAHGKFLQDWLSEGYQSVEIDVIDRGNWENEAGGPYVAHDGAPELTNCKAVGHSRLKDCLDRIIEWKRANPNKTTPLLVFIDMKASWDPGAAWKTDEVAMLDQMIGNMIPAPYRYTHADLIRYLSSAQGSTPRLRLKNKGWPTLHALQNKIVVVLTGGAWMQVNQTMNHARQFLANRGLSQNTFFCPDVDAGDPHEITTRIDGMTENESGHFFCANVRAGDHVEQVLNRSAEYRQLLHLWHASGDFGNKDYAYAYMAVAHGVGALAIDMNEGLHSTSYWRPSWVSSIPFVGVRRSLPGYFMLVTETSGDKSCLDVQNHVYRNGTPLLQFTCYTGYKNQQFVYTAEGQLRPRGHNKYCVDIDGGTAAQGKNMHLWDCDGGRSEKWFIRPDGLFASRDQGENYCMNVYGASPADATRMKLWRCNANDQAQRFKLLPVADWYPSDFRSADGDAVRLE